MEDFLDNVGVAIEAKSKRVFADKRTILIEFNNAEME